MMIYPWIRVERPLSLKKKMTLKKESIFGKEGEEINSGRQRLVSVTFSLVVELNDPISMHLIKW